MIVLVYNNKEIFFKKLMEELLETNLKFVLIEPEILTKNILFDLFKENKVFTENIQQDKNEIYIKKKIFDLGDLGKELYKEIKNINFNFFINYINKKLEENANLYLVISNDIDIIKYFQKFFSDELFVIKIIDENEDTNSILADVTINIYNNELTLKEYQKMLELIKHIINSSEKPLLENKNKQFLPQKNRKLLYFNELLKKLLEEGQKTIEKTKFKCILYSYIKEKQQGKNYKKTLEALGIPKEFQHIFGLINTFRFNKAVENIIKDNDNIYFNFDKCENKYKYQEILFVINEFINNPEVLVKYELNDDKILKNLKFLLNS